MMHDPAHDMKRWRTLVEAKATAMRLREFTTTLNELRRWGKWKPSGPDAVIALVKSKGRYEAARRIGIHYTVLARWLEKYHPDVLSVAHNLTSWVPRDPDAVITMIKAKGVKKTSESLMGVSEKTLRNWLTRINQAHLDVRPKSGRPPSKIIGVIR